jgi:hypothetical protein
MENRVDRLSDQLIAPTRASEADCGRINRDDALPVVNDDPVGRELHESRVPLTDVGWSVRRVSH